MVQDGGLYLSLRQPHLVIARTVAGSKKRIPQFWQDGPVGGERVDIPFGQTAAQMGVDVLQVFGIGGVDIARKVEVEGVFRIGDFVKRHGTARA